MLGVCADPPRRAAPHSRALPRPTIPLIALEVEAVDGHDATPRHPVR